MKNIIIAVVNLTSIITRNVTKTFKSLIIENVNTSQNKIKKIKNKIFKEDEKDLINNIVIQQLQQNDTKIVYEMKKFLKLSFNLLTVKIKRFQNKDFFINHVKSQLQLLQKRDNCVERK